jgi:hypothetical protein
MGGQSRLGHGWVGLITQVKEGGVEVGTRHPQHKLSDLMGATGLPSRELKSWNLGQMAG